MPVNYGTVDKKGDGSMKKILSCIVSAFMLVTAITANATAAGTFNDINGHWAEETIEKWQDAGIISGYPDGTFKPDNPVTRAELAKVLTTAFDLEDTNENKLISNPYSDVDTNAWYWEYIQYANIYIPVYALPVEMKPMHPMLKMQNRIGMDFSPTSMLCVYTLRNHW